MHHLFALASSRIDSRKLARGLTSALLIALTQSRGFSTLRGHEATVKISEERQDCEMYSGCLLVCTTPDELCSARSQGT